MNYLNFEIKTLRSEEFLGSEPVDRATWLTLQTYCAVQENGGRIAGCDEWGDRKWAQLVGVMKSEVTRPCELWRWDGDTLIVWAYPDEIEAKVVAKREAGRRGGSAKTDAKTRAVRENGKHGGRPSEESLGQDPESNEPKHKPKQEPKQNLSTNLTERKGKERNEKEEASLLCLEPDELASKPEWSMDFPCVGNPKVWSLPLEKFEEWEVAYPDMNVEEACRSARLWCANNRPRQKTANGMSRFLNAWLSRAQNKGEFRKSDVAPQVHYFQSTHPDALKPFDELLREDMHRSMRARAEAGDESATQLLTLIDSEL